MGEAQVIPRGAILALAKVAGISDTEVDKMIDKFATVASQFSALCTEFFHQEIRPATLKQIQQTLNKNLIAIHQ